MIWERGGTVDVENGSATIVGNGTSWATAAVLAGYGIVGPDLNWYEIVSVNSSTEITIAPAYSGATASAQTYVIIPTSGANEKIHSDIQEFLSDARSRLDVLDAPLAGFQSQFDTWLSDRLADFTAAQDARASQFATDRAQQDLDIANAMNGLEGAPIAKAIPSGAVDICVIEGASILDLNGGWTQDMSKSWAKEDRVTTTYLGVHNTTASAWAVPDATAGDWYWDGTNRNIYILTGTAGATLSTLNRFGSAHFDAQFVVAYSDRVVLVDSNGVPWKVIPTGDANCIITSVSFECSTLVVGCGRPQNAAFAVNRVELLNFASEKIQSSLANNASYQGLSTATIADHEISKPGIWTGSGYFVLVQAPAVVNAVAATVRDNAPADPVTGLPVPTIAVGCGKYGQPGGGTSIIKDDGTVVNISATTGAGGYACYDLAFTDDGRLVTSQSYNRSYSYFYVFDELPTEDIAPTTDPIGARRYTYNSTALSVLGGTNGLPQLVGISVGKNALHMALGDRLSTLWENPANPAAGMVAYQAPDYVTPPMFGDVKAALFCERGAASLVGAEYVADGDFGNAASWTASGSSAVAGGVLTVADDATNELIYNSGGTPFPRNEVANISFEINNIDANYGVRLLLVNPSNGSILSTLGGTYYTASGSYSVAVTETPIVDWVVGFQRIAGHTGTLEIDNVSVRLATPDRSVNGKGAVIHGTLSRDADGWVSGFSANDRVSQPSNSDLNYGTGDFYMMARFKADGLNRYIMDMYGAAGRTYWLINSSGYSQTSLGPVGTIVLNDGEEHIALLIRKNGITTLWVDGAKDVSAANTHNFAVGADTVLNLGTRYTHGEPITALKDFVTGEGGPSDAQAILMSNWKGDVIEGTIHDMDYVESTQGLWVLTSAYLYEIGPDGAERSKQVNDIGATTLAAFHGGRLVS